MCDGAIVKLRTGSMSGLESVSGCVPDKLNVNFQVEPSPNNFDREDDAEGGSSRCKVPAARTIKDPPSFTDRPSVGTTQTITNFSKCCIRGSALKVQGGSRNSHRHL